MNDLCERYAPYADFPVAIDARGEIVAAVLLYSYPGDEALVPLGEPVGVRAILTELELPASTLLVRMDEAADGLHDFMAPIGEPIEVLRLNLERSMFRPAPVPAGYAGARLEPEDYPSANALWDGISTDRFPEGAIFGIRDAVGQLRALAVAMAANGCPEVGTIGGVFTDPTVRGEGLARAVTSLACKHWFCAGRHRVVLNAAAGHQAAIAACQAIGFADLLRYSVVPVRPNA